jgi:hypothetical protein
MRRAALLLTCACALVLAGGAGARQSFHWEHIHVHLNAYGDYGNCGNVSWDTHKATCYATRGAELGELNGKAFFTSGSKARWEWEGSRLDVFGLDKNGATTWKLAGKKSANYWDFYVETGTKLDTARIHTYFISGDLNGSRGEPGGPLAVHLSSHQYWSGGVISHGYSMNLQGYVRVK